MKCTIPEISWHNREPVLSVDIYPILNDYYRLATGGGDCHVLIWQLNLTDEGAVKLEVISDLTRHQRAVNVVRWSPNGQYLVSADDDSNIIIWQLKTDNIPLLEGETNDKETWIVYKVLRGHKEDIYDICWSVDGLKLLSGSVDNTAILWDVTKGKMDHILSDHKGFVQGVAWDPKGQFIATISTDRMCRIFDTSGKHIRARIFKGKLPVSSEHYLYDKEVKYFHDDTFKSFYRRLQFSPDGSLLICPSGHIEVDDCKKILNGTMIFTMDNWTSPAAILPLKKQCSTVVKCCPILYELQENGPNPMINLPYRMIIAVASDHDVVLYDTQQQAPFAWLQEIHYTRLTDLTWAPDGRLLTASSTDGFCALITFENGELGVPYMKEDSETEENPLNISGVEELEEDENVDINNKEKTEKEEQKVKKNSFLLKWANSPKNVKTSQKESRELKGDSSKTEKEISGSNTTINRLVPRRIAPQKVQDAVQNESTKTSKNNKVEVGKSEKCASKEIIDVDVESTEIFEMKQVKDDKSTEEVNKTKINILTPRRIKSSNLISQTNELSVNSPSTKDNKINILTPRKPNESPINSPSTKDKNKINILTPRKTKNVSTNSQVNQKDVCSETPMDDNMSTPKKSSKPSCDGKTVDIDTKLETKTKSNVEVVTTKRITPTKILNSGGKSKSNKKLKLPEKRKSGSSLLKQWVKSPKVAKVQKEKEHDSDVEIIEEEKTETKQDSNLVKESITKVNVLIPKRIVPVKVADKAEEKKT